MPSGLRPPHAILITGASSGIGEALARGYAAPEVRLFLTGRNAARLDAVAQACEQAGASTEAKALDVLDHEGLAAWIEHIDQASPLDLVIANAGISAGTGDGGENEAQAREIFAVNLDGVINTVLPAASRMRRRGKGQIAIMSSLAGFRGFPGAPAYCASKAAVRIWGEALRGELAQDGVRVSVICPGFVRSRMTAANPFPMPLLMDAEKAAAIIRRGLARNRARIAFPWPLAAAVWCLAALSPRVTDLALRRLPKKP
ncbi:MAG: SDR family NAD(P)-dependent oxidoreductase [Kiloniellales bacterium]|nr:SDR family NAD(P)-dependent oxidoreductase [Kiloniellales bacterium]